MHVNLTLGRGLVDALMELATMGLEYALPTSDDGAEHDGGWACSKILTWGLPNNCVFFVFTTGESVGPLSER